MPELRCGKKRIPRRAPIEIFDKFKPFFIKPLPFGFRFFAAVIFPFKHGPAQRNAVITAFRLFPSAVKFMQYALPNKNVLRMFVINTRSDFIKIPELNPCKIFCSEIRVCKRSIEFAAERKFPVQLRFPLLFLGKHLFHIGLVLAVKRFRAYLRACFYHIESVLCPRNQLRGFLLCGGMFLRNGTVCFNPFRTAFLCRRNISSVELQNSFSFHFRPPFGFFKSAPPPSLFPLPRSGRHPVCGGRISNPYAPSSFTLSPSPKQSGSVFGTLLPHLLQTCRAFRPMLNGLPSSPPMVSTVPPQ